MIQTVHMRSRDKTQVICVNCDILRTKVNSLQEDQVGNESQKTAEDFSIKSCEIQIQDNLPEIGRNQNPKGNEGELNVSQAIGSSCQFVCIFELIASHLGILMYSVLTRVLNINASNRNKLTKG